MQARDRTVTVREYFRRDAESEVRLEYWHGYIVAMAGETRNHNAVKDDIVGAVCSQRSDYLVLTSGQRVRAPGYGRENYAYPDGLMVCGQEHYDETVNPPTLLNPTLLIEVTSASTKGYDLGEKFNAYFQLKSLQEYWIIDPDRPDVRQNIRTGGAVVVRLLQGLDDVLVSEALGLELPLRAIYRRVEGLS